MLRARNIISAIVLLISAGAALVLWPPSKDTVSDFTSFWIAGQQLLRRANPYDSHHALSIERSMGFTESKPLVMRNPPWSLWSVLLLGVLPYSAARIFWMLCLITMLWASAVIIWGTYGGLATQKWLPLLMTFCFGPTLACLSVGQTGPFVLFGVALFLLLRDRQQFWAGFVLLLAAFKPQIAFLFWLSLLLWCVQHKKFKTLAGLIVALALACGLAWLLDPGVIGHYRSMLSGESIEIQFIPTWGGFLRMTFGRAWLQIAPGVIGIVATVVYYFRQRREWDWKRAFPFLVLGSLLLTPYAWLGDEVLVLLVLIGAAVGLSGKRLLLKFALAYLAVNAAIVIMLVLGLRVNSPYYIWTIWMWTVSYLLLTRIRPSHVIAQPMGEAQ